MLEEQGKRLETLLTNLIDSIDRKYIRKMQRDMYKCASNCCDDQSNTMTGVQRCINECTSPVENAKQFVDNELERSKKRLDRCFEDCRDKLQDKVGPNATEESLKKYRGQYESCAAKCLENYCNSLPQLERHINESLDSKFSNL